MDGRNECCSGRFIAIDGAINVREFGGYKTCSNSTTRRGIVYRSGYLEDITERGKDELARLGVSVRFDLRSNEEKQSVSRISRNRTRTDAGRGGDGDGDDDGGDDGLPPSIMMPLQQGKFSVLGQLQKYPDDDGQRTQRIAGHYLDMVTSPTGRTAMRALLLFILQNPGDKILIHCTLGKDRTGVVFGLLLALAGVPDEHVIRDFALSGPGLQPIRPRFVRYLRKLDSRFSDEQAELYADKVLTANPKCMAILLRELRSRFGGVYEYVRDACGLTETQIERLRQRLVEPGLDD
ncbi:hypothetical protein CDD83_8507 [Cordyceps sp. RAO-2017]|nr:hypothetical protein CDD83_8507 [Cordyceps sp. RAO-2017]